MSMQVDKVILTSEGVTEVTAAPSSVLTTPQGIAAAGPKIASLGSQENTVTAAGAISSSGLKAEAAAPAGSLKPSDGSSSSSSGSGSSHVAPSPAAATKPKPPSHVTLPHVARDTALLGGPGDECTLCNAPAPAAAMMQQQRNLLARVSELQQEAAEHVAAAAEAERLAAAARARLGMIETKLKVEIANRKQQLKQQQECALSDLSELSAAGEVTHHHVRELQSQLAALLHQRKMVKKQIKQAADEYNTIASARARTAAAAKESHAAAASLLVRSDVAGTAAADKLAAVNRTRDRMTEATVLLQDAEARRSSAKQQLLKKQQHLDKVSHQLEATQAEQSSHMKRLASVDTHKLPQLDNKLLEVTAQQQKLHQQQLLPVKDKLQQWEQQQQQQVTEAQVMKQRVASAAGHLVELDSTAAHLLCEENSLLATAAAAEGVKHGEQDRAAAAAAEAQGLKVASTNLARAKAAAAATGATIARTEAAAADTAGGGITSAVAGDVDGVSASGTSAAHRSSDRHAAGEGTAIAAAAAAAAGTATGSLITSGAQKPVEKYHQELQVASTQLARARDAGASAGTGTSDIAVVGTAGAAAAVVSAAAAVASLDTSADHELKHKHHHHHHHHQEHHHHHLEATKVAGAEVKETKMAAADVAAGSSDRAVADSAGSTKTATVRTFDNKVLQVGLKDVTTARPSSAELAVRAELAHDVDKTRSSAGDDDDDKDLNQARSQGLSVPASSADRPSAGISHAGGVAHDAEGARSDHDFDEDLDHDLDHYLPASSAHQMSAAVTSRQAVLAPDADKIMCDHQDQGLNHYCDLHDGKIPVPAASADQETAATSHDAELAYAAELSHAAAVTGDGVLAAAADQTKVHEAEKIADEQHVGVETARRVVGLPAQGSSSSSSGVSPAAVRSVAGRTGGVAAAAVTRATQPASDSSSRQQQQQHLSSDAPTSSSPTARIPAKCAANTMDSTHNPAAAAAAAAAFTATTAAPANRDDEAMYTILAADKPVGDQAQQSAAAATRAAYLATDSSIRQQQQQQQGQMSPRASTASDTSSSPAARDPLGSDATLQYSQSTPSPTSPAAAASHAYADPDRHRSRHHLPAEPPVMISDQVDLLLQRQRLRRQWRLEVTPLGGAADESSQVEIITTTPQQQQQQQQQQHYYHTDDQHVLTSPRSDTASVDLGSESNRLSEGGLSHLSPSAAAAAAAAGVGATTGQQLIGSSSGPLGAAAVGDEESLMIKITSSRVDSSASGVPTAAAAAPAAGGSLLVAGRSSSSSSAWGQMPSEQLEMTPSGPLGRESLGRVSTAASSSSSKHQTSRGPLIEHHRPASASTAASSSTAAGGVGDSSVMRSAAQYSEQHQVQPYTQQYSPRGQCNTPRSQAVQGRDPVFGRYSGSTSGRHGVQYTGEYEQPPKLSGYAVCSAEPAAEPAAAAGGDAGGALVNAASSSSGTNLGVIGGSRSGLGRLIARFEQQQPPQPPQQQQRQQRRQYRLRGPLEAGGD